MSEQQTEHGAAGPTLSDSFEPGKRRKRGSSLTGCLPVLLVLAVLGGGGYFAYTEAMDALDGIFSEAEDFSGPGTGSVTFEVEDGDSVAQIGRNLKDEGVVASVEAFTAAASGNPDATGIQVGFYELRNEMSAADALEVLVNPNNLVNNSVTIPEGLQVDQIVALIARNTDATKKQLNNALRKPDEIGLPDYADGEPEGYLFPATYDFGPNAKARDMITAMVDRWRQAAEASDLEARAEELGYTPHELMTVASMVQAEARGDDMPKVSRVIYNRIEIEPNPSAGFLQIDATVNYALGEEGIARLTIAQIDSVADNPYNTYRQQGLPPGPIGAPGDAAIEAATTPADGPWFFYVTVNLATGETKFTDSFDEFNQFKAEFDEYCRTQSDRC